MIFEKEVDYIRKRETFMRRARKEELEEIATFIVERFEGLEQFMFLYKDFENAKSVMKKVTASELNLYFDKGDILIEDAGALHAVSVAIKSTKFTFLNILLNSLKTQPYLSELSKSDLVILKEKMKLQNKLHNRKWFKRYCKDCYYITQIAISKEKKGSGLFRKVITPILEECQKNDICVVLETFTESNVSLYEYFGFKLVEIHTNDCVLLTEYCMIKGN